MSKIDTSDLVTSRTFSYTDDGECLTPDEIVNHAKEGMYNKWLVEITERSQRVPIFRIKHIHVGSARSIRQQILLTSIDGTCTCGKTFPQSTIEDVIQRYEKSARSKLYSGIELPNINTRRDLKYLAEDWYLDKRDKEICLFHICNENHPAYLYYGKGIPINYIAWPPRPNRCKTCNVEIPKGVRIAVLMMNQKAELK